MHGNAIPIVKRLMEHMGMVFLLLKYVGNTLEWCSNYSRAVNGF